MAGRARPFKGCNYSRYIEDYTIVDLETTGISPGESRIIEIGALRVRGGRIAGEFSTLIDPGCHIPAAATAVNHITDSMVADAPGLGDVIDDFLDFVGDDVILGWNNAAFDMNFLYDDILRLRRRHFSNSWLDVLYAARRCLPIPRRSLQCVCEYYGIDTAGEHRALTDCYLTKACYDRIYEEYGAGAFEKRGRSEGARKTRNLSVKNFT